MMRYYLGLDAGGSRCRCRIIDAEGRSLGAAEGGPANLGLGLEAFERTMGAVVHEARREAGLDEAALAQTAAGLGVAGLSRRGARAALEARGFPFARTAVDTDAAIAQRGAHAGGDGAILIIGTGSVAYIRQGDTVRTMGGYGFPISDEASGAALGLSAMRHALRALDGRTKTTALSAAVSAQFHHETSEAVAWMETATPRDYGTLAPIVMDHAETGDEIALLIVQDAVRHIEKFIETIFAAGAERCVLMGGLSARMQPWLRARTAARLSEPLGDALDGALHLAGHRARPADAAASHGAKAALSSAGALPA